MAAARRAVDKEEEGLAAAGVAVRRRRMVFRCWQQQK